MIRAIHGGPNIAVTGPSHNLPSIDHSQPMAGIVRYKNYTFEVYDGVNWLPATASAPHIDLSSDVIEIINWAKQEMAREKEIEKLSQNHPAIKAAHEQVKRATDQLKATILLSKDEETTS